MFLIDLEQGRIIDDSEIKAQLAASKPYRQWIDALRMRLDEVAGPDDDSVPQPTESLLDRQQAFGYTQEDIKFLMAPMALNGEEAIGSMGTDTPITVLSAHNKPFYHYFKQRFAQVTNPPIDPIREENSFSDDLKLPYIRYNTALISHRRSENKVETAADYEIGRASCRERV